MQISNLFREKTVFSYEVFPPKDTSRLQTIYDTIDTLHSLHPDFISVTYGAGGSGNCDSSVTIADYIQKTCGEAAVVHLSGLYTSSDQAALILENFRRHGIENILALRGDRTADKTDTGGFPHASDLVAFIKQFDQRKNDGRTFCVSGACYPEKHPESDSFESDMENLKQKTDKGSSYLISQLFFDNAVFYRFLERARRKGITVPVEAGIMPVRNKKQIEHITRLSGNPLPKQFQSLVDACTSKESLEEAGIAYAADQIADLIHHGVQGIHLYTMNNGRTAQKIHEAVKERL